MPACIANWGGSGRDGVGRRLARDEDAVKGGGGYMTAITDFRSFEVFLVTITKALATEWLTARNAVNRYKRPSVISQYTRDMAAKRWLLTGETISFDWNGQLINGQHRLQAVVESGQPMQALVVVGLDPAVRTVVDTQSRRSVRDAFSHAGKNQMLGEGGTVGGNTAAGMWSRMKYGIRQTKGLDTRQELLAFADTYPEGGLFAIEVFGKLPRVSQISTASVMAAVARAYYHYDDTFLGRLERFVQVLVTGKSVNELESSIHVLRLFLTGLREDGKVDRNYSGPRNSNAQAETYGKTCRAIQAFMAGEEVPKRLYLPSSDPFPLPDRSGQDGGADRILGDGRRSGSGRSGSPEVVIPLPIGRAH